MCKSICACIHRLLDIDGLPSPTWGSLPHLLTYAPGELMPASSILGHSTPVQIPPKTLPNKYIIREHKIIFKSLISFDSN